MYFIDQWWWSDAYWYWYWSTLNVIPLLVGVLSWLIDWIQHRRTNEPGAPSDEGSGRFDPAGPTRMRG